MMVVIRASSAMVSMIARTTALVIFLSVNVWHLLYSQLVIPSLTFQAWALVATTLPSPTMLSTAADSFSKASCFSAR